MKYLLGVVFLFLSIPAYADCIDPYSCICVDYDNFSGVYVGTVTEQKSTVETGPRVKVTIEAIHLREGQSRSAGPELGDSVEASINEEPGTKVLLEFDDAGNVYAPIAADPDGQVRCDYATDDFMMSLEDTLQAKLGDCRAALDEAGFQAPPCNDTPFGCSATQARRFDWSSLFLFFLVGAIFWRLRKMAL